MLNFTATRKSSRVHFWLFTIGIALLSGCSEEVTNERDRLFSMEAPQRTASHINSEINIQVASDAINRAIELSFIALEKERPNASSQLLRCIELQVVMKDFEGALDTFFKTPQSVFSKGDILDLADAFATSGETETAKVFLALLPPSYTSDDEVLQASVDTSSIRADINAGNLERAAKKTHRLTIPILRQELFCLLAIAFYEQHEEIKTDEYLTAAVDELENLPRNRLRERLIKTAESQIQTNRVKPARKTIQRLIDPNNIYRDLTTYYQTAVLYARSGDHEKANSTFQQAELLRLELSEDNQSQIVNNTFSLSYYQTEAGYFSEARKNAEKLSHDSFEYRNALLKIVEYQLEANTPEEAIQTAESSLSSQHDQDNAWVAIAHYYIKREEWRQAESIASKIEDKTINGNTILDIALAAAKAGHLNLAEDIASRMNLIENDFDHFQEELTKFDYKNPATWSIDYDYTDSFSNASFQSRMGKRTTQTNNALALALFVPYYSDIEYLPLLKNAFKKRNLARTYAQGANPTNIINVVEQFQKGFILRIDENRTISFDRKSAVYGNTENEILIGLAEGILLRNGFEIDKPTDNRGRSQYRTLHVHFPWNNACCCEAADASPNQDETNEPTQIPD